MKEVKEGADTINNAVMKVDLEKEAVMAGLMRKKTYSEGGSSFTVRSVKREESREVLFQRGEGDKEWERVGDEIKEEELKAIL